MIQETYGMTVTTEMDVAAAEEAIVAALADQGFGIMSEIDVAATLAAKIGVERPPYKILGACNPKLANRALDTDERIGLLLPCNVVVAEGGDGAVVSILDPTVMVDVTRNAEMKAIADEARTALEKALTALE